MVAAPAAAERVLITLDQGMGDIRAYTPGSHAGIVVLRLPDQSAAAVTQAITDLASFAEPTTLAGAIAVLQRGLLRIAITDGGRLMHRCHPKGPAGICRPSGPAEAGACSDIGGVGSLLGSLTTTSLQWSWMRSVGMTLVQRTGRTPLDLPAGGADLIWEQEAAGSNPAIPTVQRSLQGESATRRFTPVGVMSAVVRAGLASGIPATPPRARRVSMVSSMSSTLKFRIV